MFCISQSTVCECFAYFWQLLDSVFAALCNKNKKESKKEWAALKCKYLLYSTKILFAKLSKRCWTESQNREN